VLIEALAIALARQHRFIGDELRHRVSDLTGPPVGRGRNKPRSHGC
jgi:hypothetical protein